MDKMKRTARILDGFFRVLFWVLAALCAVFAVLCVVMLVGGERLAQSSAFQSMTSQLVFTYNGLSFAYALPPTARVNQTFVLLSALFCVTSAFVLYGIAVVRQILAPMKAGSPFCAAVSARFRRLAWLSLILGAVEGVVMHLSRGMLWSVLSGTTDEWASLLVANRPHMVTLDATCLLVAALLFLFSFVFQYGETLQRLSDETL